jgi:branched-chain amino acid transport system ATP-binding protein
MPEALLQIIGLTKRFGGLVVTDDFSLDILRGTTHAIIGPNGAGKTTLVRQIQGELRSDDGTILLNGGDITNLSAAKRARIGISRTFQITSIFPEFSVLANVALASQMRQGHSFRFWSQVEDDQSLLKPARDFVKIVGLEDRTHVLAQHLSHGERRQLELAIALATEPALLLLDEPMAGMGGLDSAKITQLLKSLKHAYTIVLIEHDMEAVFQLADYVTVLVSGRNIATDEPEKIRANPQVLAAYLGNFAGR